MPTKAAYLEFETSPDLWWEFYIADRLGRTVAELRESMSSDEFIRWVIFHRREEQREQLELRKAG